MEGSFPLVFSVIELNPFEANTLTFDAVTSLRTLRGFTFSPTRRRCLTFRFGTSMTSEAMAAAAIVNVLVCASLKA